MNELKNKRIEELIGELWDDSNDEVYTDLLREFVDILADSEVLCPVEDDQIVLYGWGRNMFLPVFTDMDNFKKTFKEESPEIFEFKHLEEFVSDDIDGIIINPNGNGFILGKLYSKLVFNKNRERGPVSEGYDVKVRLNDLRPLTWRDLIIPENITFMELDDILKTLWGFNGHHLSCFLVTKSHLTIMDEKLAEETMMGCDYDANTTLVSEIFDRYDKVTYWYDFGDDWRFDIEIKKKVDYTKDYVTIKRFKGKYNPVEDCKGIYGLSDIIYYAEHPDEADSSYLCELVDYLEEFDMEYTQFLLEYKAYVESMWKED